MRRIISMCLMLFLSACGGGGGGGGGGDNLSNGNTGSTSANSVTMKVDSGPSGVQTLNIPYVSVTICAPGSTSNCQVVDHVLVDTGSSGLRILASALSASVIAGLGNQQVGGRQVVECMQFVSSITWGAVKLADVRMAGKAASALPMQLVSDPVYTTIPGACSSRGTNAGSLAGLGANGIIGVRHDLQDCGSACANSSLNSMYYLCAGASSCVGGAVPVTQQVANPVANFSGDNNGVLLQLPSVPATGTATATGSLIFGIGTQSNNAIPAGAQAYPTTSASGFTINTLYKGLNYSSFLDSGSNLLVFPDGSINTCVVNGQTWFCPPSQQNLSAVLSSGTSSSVINFSVIDASQYLQGANSAIPGIAAPASGSLGGQFDWGLPFFYGRSVFIGFVGGSNPLGSGPMYIF